MDRAYGGHRAADGCPRSRRAEGSIRVFVAPLRALSLGQLALEIGELVRSALVLVCLVGGHRGVAGLVLLSRSLLLGLAQLLGCRLALVHRPQATATRRESWPGPLCPSRRSSSPPA